jgi:CHAT domain-containing protein
MKPFPTAEGGDRAVLGLAGVAVRAGARSTVATLWQVNDEAMSLLMKQFYQELKPTVGKAIALLQQRNKQRDRFRPRRFQNLRGLR